jgi:transcriptional regulator with XRE-family HTH domain
MFTCLSDEAMEKFGQVLRTLRKQRRWSQTVLANEAGVSLSMIQKAEAADEPTMHDSNFHGLAKAFGMTPDQLDALWRGEVIQLFIPREVYDAAAADAARMKLTVEGLIAKKLGVKISGIRRTDAGKGSPESKDTQAAESH